MENSMFCFQCQETAGNKGCTKIGVCGKSAQVANLQDLLRYVTAGLSDVTTRLRREGKTVDKSVNHLITTNLFTTITNANFDADAISKRIMETVAVKKNLLPGLKNKTGLSAAALWESDNISEMEGKAKSIGVLSTENEDIRSLRELVAYGLKGLSAYVKHANVLGKENEKIDAFIQSALAKILDDSLTVDDLVSLTLETGNNGVAGMALLDEANTSAYGNPEITKVNIGVINGVETRCLIWATPPP